MGDNIKMLKIVPRTVLREEYCLFLIYRVRNCSSHIFRTKIQIPVENPEKNSQNPEKNSIFRKKKQKKYTIYRVLYIM